MKIGLALGSGSARGWAHIGVIQELLAMGIVPDVVAGCSVGSFVGAAYASGGIDALEKWVLSLNMREALGLVDVSLSGGLLRGDKLLNFFRETGLNSNIEELPVTYGTLATEMVTGQEIWLRSGPVLDAVRASCTFPGLFAPQKTNDKWLLDGGLVNPVPVSLCRALGADIVIAVDLNTYLVSRVHEVRHRSEDEHRKACEQENGALEKIKSWFSGSDAEESTPGVMDVMTATINIMQDRITRSRMAGDPPDILLTPRLMDIAMLDVDKGAKAIKEGRTITRMASQRLKEVCGLETGPEKDRHPVEDLS